MPSKLSISVVAVVCCAVAASISPIQLPAGGARSSRGAIIVCSPCSAEQTATTPSISSKGAIIVTSYAVKQIAAGKHHVDVVESAEVAALESAPGQLRIDWASAVWQALAEFFAPSTLKNSLADENTTLRVVYAPVSESVAALGMTTSSLW